MWTMQPGVDAPRLSGDSPFSAKGRKMLGRFSENLKTIQGVPNRRQAKPKMSGPPVVAVRALHNLREGSPTISYKLQ